MPWVLLAAAIATELVGTLALRRLADGTAWWALVLVVVAYVLSFACLAVSLRRINVGVAYAVWSAVGTTAVSVAGAVLFGERLSAQAVIGMVVVVIGIVVLVTSGSVSH